MTASMMTTALYKPCAVGATRARFGAAPSLPCVGRKTSVKVYARNFKTRETEREIEKNVPDSDELNAKLQNFVEGIQAKWEETDEKPAVVAVGAAAFVAIWALSGLVDRLDKLPLVGGFLELVGLLVTGWFTYRYLTFAPDREELKKSVDTFYSKVTGKKNW